MRRRWPAPEGLGAVGCESCHGPGADYKSMTVMKSREAAVAAGCVVPNEKVCTTCHNVEAAAAVGITIKPFNWAEMYPKIEHHIPKADSAEGIIRFPAGAAHALRPGGGTAAVPPTFSARRRAVPLVRTFR